MGLKETGQKIVKKVIRVFARGSGKSLTLQRGIPIMVEVRNTIRKITRFRITEK